MLKKHTGSQRPLCGTCTCFSETGFRTGRRQWTWGPTLAKKVFAIDTAGKGRSLFSSGVSLGTLTTPPDRSHAQEYCPTQNEINATFVDILFCLFSPLLVFSSFWFSFLWGSCFCWGFSLVWSSAVWFAVGWFAMVRCSVVWLGMVWRGLVWLGIVWCSLVWGGVVFCALVWFFDGWK